MAGEKGHHSITITLGFCDMNKNITGVLIGLCQEVYIISEMLEKLSFCHFYKKRLISVYEISLLLNENEELR